MALLLTIFSMSCGHLLTDKDFPLIGYVNSRDDFFEEEVIVKSISVDRGQIKLNYKVYFMNGDFRLYPRQKEYVSPYESIQIRDTVILSSNPGRIEIIGHQGKHIIFTELNNRDETWFDEWW